MPVVAKEVGWGISPQTAQLLADAGVAAIDVAGSGGTSWSQVEYHRTEDPLLQRLARTFADWGIPTAESLLLVSELLPDMPLFASGGLRTGIDVAKSIALGATLAGMAGAFLRAAAQSAEATVEVVRLIQRQLQIAMFAAGAQDIAALQRTPLVRD